VFAPAANGDGLANFKEPGALDPNDLTNRLLAAEEKKTNFADNSSSDQASKY